jgi:putative tryptophan/tyrosine transport system substrate-binding protein
MKAKILVYALPVLILTTIHLVEAQQTKVPRIGYVATISASSIQDRYEAFRRGLRELGYVEGQTILLEARFAEGKPERLPDLVAELIRIRVDVLVTSGPPSTRAAVKSSSTIPIVMAEDPDPVAAGFVASLARPGGNITGLSTLSPEITGKRLEILKEILPQLSRVAILGTLNVDSKRETDLAAKVLRIQLENFKIAEAKELDGAFREARQSAEALMILENPVILSQRKQVVALAAASRLPTIYPWPEFVEEGGLMTYTASRTDLFHRAATYVDKILKGRKPTDLPVEQPIKFEFIINLKTAKQIGLTIPPNVLARADKVIK